MIPPGTTLVMLQMEAGCVTGIGMDLTAWYFADHKTAVKDTTLVMKKRAKNYAWKGGMETRASRVSTYCFEYQEWPSSKPKFNDQYHRKVLLDAIAFIFYKSDNNCMT